MQRIEQWIAPVSEEEEALEEVILASENQRLALVGIGVALGELTGYSTGVGGRGVIGNSRMGRILVRLMRRHGTLTVFCVAAVPNPFIDVCGIAAGVAGMTMRRFIVVMFVGKTINYITVAY